MTLIPLLPSNDEGSAFAVNAGGRVVGYCWPAGDADHPRAFLFFNGTTHDLNDYLPPSAVAQGYQLQKAYLLSDDDYVMGIAMRNGVRRAYVLRVCWN